MTFRGVVQNGRVVLTDGELPDGSVVRVELVAKRASAASRTKTAKSKRVKRLPKAVTNAFGMWKDRADLSGTAVEAVAKLRTLSRSRRRAR